MPAKFSFEHGHLQCQASVTEKKNRGLAVLLGVSREPRPRPIRGWVADLFLCENQGGREGRFCHFDD